MPYKNPSNIIPFPPRPQSRFPVRIPVRMTEAERAAIGKTACRLNRSISRYLVELATLAKSGFLPEQKARFTFFHALLQNATEKVQAALGAAQWAPGAGEVMEIRKTTLEETLRLLEALSQEVGRGLE